MSKPTIPPMPAGLLPKLTYRDGERLNRSIELLDAAHNALAQNRNSTTYAVNTLLYEAQKPIIEIRAKIYAAMQRWSRRFGVDLEDVIAESGEPGAPATLAPGEDESAE